MDEEQHPMQRVALMLAEAAAKAMTHAKLKEAIEALESMDSDEREHGGNGMARDVLALLVRERGAR